MITIALVVLEESYLYCTEQWVFCFKDFTQIFLSGVASMLGLHSLQDWQVQTLQSLHQTTLESEDLAILDSERDLSMYVFKDMIFKASSMILG